MICKLSKYITGLIFVSVLTACVTTQYKYLNQTYTSREEAIAAAQRNDAEIEAGIPQGSTPLVDRKLLFVIPTAMAFQRMSDARVAKQGKTRFAPGTPARANEDFMIDTFIINNKSIASSIKKANIYREVEIVDVDSTESSLLPTPQQDVLTLFWGVESASPSYYFNRIKTGKQVLAVDHAGTQIERRKSIVDDVRSKALQ